ncbi:MULTISPECIES: NAD(P)H-dependent oxidoreductase [unclassified Streptomyces]|uniref:FMN-dependent NADH-azoreductase n=1 Tax=unclassified Streptomyces TaxID=2593676 RepID=UPI00081D407B|nr:MULTISPECIES: NAD(P)H-dependent oxidoreductase [unclassified Streptomyces]MYZ39785.1 FMN-dependent NADH-azoreductase [Streptomyces sp. SID4917]SCG05242.1 FMN-dependent NADH-azoreductase [Streptomyces sp. MnatMP-M17]
MATLLHIDSAVFPEGSASRDLTATFVKSWLEQHPEGKVIYRDLAATPLPHLDIAAVSAGAEDTLRAELAAELAEADAVLIGAPMYNFTIPSTLKAWLDQVIIVGHNAGPDSTVADTPFTIVASRGGSYAPGTPREDFEFVQNYLEKVLTGMFGATEIDFIVPELTLAPSKPEMAELVPLAEASRAKATEEATQKAKALAARHAA